MCVRKGELPLPILKFLEGIGRPPNVCTVVQPTTPPSFVLVVSPLPGMQYYYYSLTVLDSLSLLPFSNAAEIRLMVGQVDTRTQLELSKDVCMYGMAWRNSKHRHLVLPAVLIQPKQQVGVNRRAIGRNLKPDHVCVPGLRCILTQSF